MRIFSLKRTFRFMSRIYVIFHDCLLSYTTVCYIRFSSVGLNRLKNELLAEYLKKITVGQSCEYQRPALLCCQITLSKCKYNRFPEVRTIGGCFTKPACGTRKSCVPFTGCNASPMSALPFRYWNLTALWEIHTGRPHAQYYFVVALLLEACQSQFKRYFSSTNII